ncbi:MAG: hypothetical protein AAFS10_08935 [Myxococcota bacterium]
MGYGLMVYSVDFDALLAAIGSGDNGIRRAISGRYKRDINRLNDNLGWSNERGEPSVFEAIRHLIMGDAKTLPGAMYGYGYKFIVEFYGQFLNNANYCPCSLSFMEEHRDPAMEALGLSVRVSDLGLCSAPIDFPFPNGFPGFGYWSPEEVSTAADTLSTHTSQLSEEMEDIRGWLQTAQRQGHGIIGFYH